MKKTLSILLSAMVLTLGAATAVKAENIEQRAPKSIMNQHSSREQHRKQFEQRLNLTKRKSTSNSQTGKRRYETCYYAN